jgi:hypothetical protein
MLLQRGRRLIASSRQPHHRLQHIRRLANGPSITADITVSFLTRSRARSCMRRWSMCIISDSRNGYGDFLLLSYQEMWLQFTDPPKHFTWTWFTMTVKASNKSITQPLLTVLDGHRRRRQRPLPSPISIPRPLRDRRHILPSQYCSLHL